MEKYIKTSRDGNVAIITLNRPEKLNAWHTAMRNEIIAALAAFNTDTAIGAIVMTGAGDRAFCAGQDLEEAHGFDQARADEWMSEWENYYRTIRTLQKPLLIALNGTAAGSAFQVALLADIRVGHAGSRMGQPEINSGIPSVTGPWIMKQMLGISRTIELTLTGRMMEAAEAHALGLIHHLVEPAEVLPKTLEIARELAAKPSVAMRLNKQRFCEVSEESFVKTIAAGRRIQMEAYATGEPARMMEEFFKKRGHSITK